MPVLSVPNILAAATGKPYAIRHRIPKPATAPVRHRGSYVRPRTQIVLDGWRLALIGASLTITTSVATIALVVGR